MRSRLGIVVWMGIAATVPLAGQALQGPTAEGWQAYVAATEARVVRQRGEALTFSEPVTRGKVVVEQVKMRGPRGDLDVPGATINHWRGVVLIPGASLDDMLARLEREPPGLKQPDVVSSAVLESRPGWARVSLRLHRSFVLSAVFDTEHEVTFLRQSRTRASSQSTATRIVSWTARERLGSEPSGPTRTGDCSGGGMPIGATSRSSAGCWWNANRSPSAGPCQGSWTSSSRR
jgi:hypothetical protein